MDREAAVRAIAALLRSLDLPPEGELADTPRLCAEAWCDELLAGYREDPAALLRAGAAAAPVEAGPVLVASLDVVTVCPHHLLPADGRGDVVYLPGPRLAGLGAVARALDALTRRLVLQERAGGAMAALLVEALGARGALCRLRLRHGCLGARGTRQAAAEVSTLSFAGCYAEPGPEREAALGLLGPGVT